MTRLRTARTVVLTVLGAMCIATGLACPDSPAPRPTNEGPVHLQTASATEAVCSATRNAYFKDAIGSDITGKAIFDLSNQEHVNASVRNAVHDLFTADGKTTSADYGSAYERVMSACTATGWEPK
jgi:hypothetical protein